MVATWAADSPRMRASSSAPLARMRAASRLASERILLASRFALGRELGGELAAFGAHLVEDGVDVFLGKGNTFHANLLDVDAIAPHRDRCGRRQQFALDLVHL